MALKLNTNQLEKFIGTFYRINARNPPSKPDIVPDTPLERLVITQGVLQMSLRASAEDPVEQVDVIIPINERVFREQYQMFTNILAQELSTLLQVPEHLGNIYAALQANGLVAQFFGSQLKMNPLAEGQGELDQF